MQIHLSSSSFVKKSANRLLHTRQHLFPDLRWTFLGVHYNVAALYIWTRERNKYLVSIIFNIFKEIAAHAPTHRLQTPCLFLPVASRKTRFQEGSRAPKTPFNVNTCKAQLHFIEISGVSILFGEKLEA